MFGIGRIVAYDYVGLFTPVIDGRVRGLPPRGRSGMSLLRSLFGYTSRSCGRSIGTRSIGSRIFLRTCR